MNSMPPATPPDAGQPALAIYLMGELQRYRAHGGPVGALAQRFVLAIDAADDVRIAPDVMDRLAMLAQAPEALDDAELRWVRNQLPEIVRQIALVSPAPAWNGSSPASPARSHVPPAPGSWSAGSP
ncbi:hypothetical protein [Massilia sp. CFBP9026]|uniref:hypothetical protein n=1 Tax=Massilia sp. CFBP9026 TaxID=3096536 RepID=UPI002A6AD1B2|nr:hypothetical protein [Massilia sp. CFBP9026]MDY0963531.1 hypothetical protein [Massilia sp. CFBP9026]